MSIIKNISNEKPFEVIPRELLQQCDKKRKNSDNKPLSLQAIGLLCNLQSYPESWEIHKTELYNRYEKNGRRQIQSAWNELVDARYIVQFKVYENNKLEYYYYFSTFAISDDQIKELEEYHNSEKLERFDLKQKNPTVQNEQSSNDGVLPTVQNEQYNLYSTEVNSTKRTDNIINNQHNTHDDNTHDDNTDYYSKEKQDKNSSSSKYQKLIKKLQKEFNIKITETYQKELYKLFENFNEDIIVYAIEYSSNNADYPKKYIKSILEVWKNEGIKTVEEAQNYKIQFKKTVKNSKSNREMTPQWLQDRDKTISEDPDLVEDPDLEADREAFLEQLQQQWSN